MVPHSHAHIHPPPTAQVIKLLENRADGWMVNNNKMTPYHCALRAGLTNITSIFTPSSADEDVSTFAREGSALQMAADRGDLDALEKALGQAWLSNEADLAMSTDNGVTSLMLACRRLHLGAVKRLIAEGIRYRRANRPALSLRTQTRKGVTALASA